MLFLSSILAVSVDAYVAGLGVAIKGSRRIKVCLLVVAVCCALCFIAELTGVVLSKYGDAFKILGGVIFIYLGINNLFQESGNVSNCLLFAFTVSVDAMIATVFLADPSNLIVLPILMSVMHGVFVFLGMKCVSIVKNERILSVVSCIAMIIFGILKAV